MSSTSSPFFNPRKNEKTPCSCVLKEPDSSSTGVAGVVVDEDSTSDQLMLRSWRRARFRISIGRMRADMLLHVAESRAAVTSSPSCTCLDFESKFPQHSYSCKVMQGFLRNAATCCDGYRVKKVSADVKIFACHLSLDSLPPPESFSISYRAEKITPHLRHHVLWLRSWCFNVPTLSTSPTRYIIQ